MATKTDTTEQAEKPQTAEDVQAIIDGKEKTLAVKYATGVHGFFFADISNPGKWVIGYLKEPTRAVKAIAMDQTLMGKGFSIGQQVAEACLLKEESDPRTYSPLPVNDRYVLGTWDKACDLVEIAKDFSKKK